MPRSAPRSASPSAPEVSVILPGFLSHDTVAGCLAALRRQTYGDPRSGAFEVIVVDSSPDPRTAHAVAAFPEVRLVCSPQRLLPHAARNEGARLARGELLVFIDPDVYAEPGWLTALVAAYRASGHPVVGALTCHGDRWLDVAVHLCKFSKWLPGGAPRPVDMSPTANMLVDRAAFADAGGFAGELMLGDALLSWQLVRRGHTLWFEPRAVVAHHHLTDLRSFLRERYKRGRLFAELRATWFGHGRLRDLAFLAVSVLPVRLVRITGFTFAQCAPAGHTGRLLATLPVVLAGHLASLMGEARVYARRLLGSAAGGDAPSARDEATAVPSPDGDETADVLAGVVAARGGAAATEDEAAGLGSGEPASS